jgi:hypothetical protein
VRPRRNSILDKLDAGMADGERYSAASSAKGRAAWRVIQDFTSVKTEAQCREMIRQLIKNGVLVEETYVSPGRREEQQGLRVVATKRPGGVIFWWGFSVLSSLYTNTRIE